MLLPAGIGLEFGRNMREETAHYYDPMGFDYFDAHKTRTLRLRPAVYFKYQKPIGEKFNAGLRFTTKLNMEGIKRLSSSTGVDYISTEETTFGLIYPGFQLNPEIQYFITNRLGLGVKTGGIYYSAYKLRYLGGENKASNFSINLNPAQWEWGLILLFKK